MSRLERYIQANGLAKTESLLRDVAQSLADEIRDEHPEAARAIEPPEAARAIEPPKE